MRALVLVKEGAAEQAFDLQELPTPKPGKGKVLIAVSHFGLNYADVMSRLGLYNDRPALPVILGYEAVGVIKELGEGVTEYAIGDRVLAFTHFGGYADHVVTPALGLVKLTDDVPSEIAPALATQYCTAWYAACMMMNLNAGDKVLIHAAAGGVGTALVQIAKWKGCEVFGTVGSDKKMDYLKSIGVDHAINYRKVDFAEKIAAMLNNDRLDVAFDPVGGSTFKRSLQLLGSGGRIVTFGASEWSSTKGGFIDKLKLAFGFGFLHPIGLLMKSRSVIGVNMLRIGENKPEYLAQAKREVFAHFQSGVLKPTIDNVYSYKELAEAHTALEKRNTIGKVVVAW